MSTGFSWGFNEWLGFARRRVRILAATIVMGGLGGAGVNLLLTPLYEASVLMEMELGQERAFLPAAEPFLQQQNELATQAELARSRAVLERACARLASGDCDHRRLGEAMRAAPMRGTNLLSISVRDPDPSRASDLANAIATSLVEASVERRQEESRRVRTFLDGQLVKIQAELRRSEANLSRRAVHVNEEMYRMLLAKRHEANVMEHSQIGEIVVVDPAVRLDEPVRPRTLFNVVFGLFLGALVGMLGALWMEKEADSVKSIEELENDSSVPVLGWIPQMNGKHSIDWKTLPARVLRHGERAGELEPYSLLAANLKLIPSEVPQRTILVTSALPQEGKTRTSIALALAMAREGQKVALVEADLRRPGFEKLFMTGSRPGLAEVLAGKVSLSNALQPLDPETKFLHVLPAGEQPSNPGKLFRNEKLQEVLDDLRKGFDMVLVDTSPILVTPDTLNLAPSFDGVLFIVRSERTPRRLLARSLKQLNRAGVNVLGVVLNGVIQHAPAHYGGYYDYYGYGYGRGRSEKEKAALKG